MNNYSNLKEAMDASHRVFSLYAEDSYFSDVLFLKQHGVSSLPHVVELLAVVFLTALDGGDNCSDTIKRIVDNNVKSEQDKIYLEALRYPEVPEDLHNSHSLLEAWYTQIMSSYTKCHPVVSMQFFIKLQEFCELINPYTAGDYKLNAEGARQFVELLRLYCKCFYHDDAPNVFFGILMKCMWIKNRHYICGKDDQINLLNDAIIRHDFNAVKELLSCLKFLPDYAVLDFRQEMEMLNYYFDGYRTEEKLYKANTAPDLIAVHICANKEWRK